MISTISKVDMMQLRRTTIVVLAALGLGACAQIPDLGKAASPKTISNYSASQSLAAEQGAWPEDQWWVAYGDTQLDNMMSEALSGSPNMAIAQARLLRAEGYAQEQGANLYPSVNADASVMRQKQSYNAGTPLENEVIPRGSETYGNATLDFSYEIDFWGKNRAAVAAATSGVTASRADVQQARLALTAGIASTYAELSQLFAERDTAVAALAVRQKTVDLFRMKYENGLETLSAVKQVEAQKASAHGALLAIDESLALTRNQLAALIGAGPDRGLDISRPTIELANVRGLPVEIPAQLLGRRPDIVAARLRAEAAAKRIDVARTEFYPNVNLSAFVGVQSMGLNMLGKSGSSIGGIGPAVSLPIFDAGHLQGQYRGARADYDEAVAVYDDTVTHALQDVANVATSERALTQRLLQAQLAVDSAREAYHIVENRYQGGMANHLEVLNAEDIMLSSERDLVAMQSRMFILDVSLVRALGGGYKQG